MCYNGKRGKNRVMCRIFSRPPFRNGAKQDKNTYAIFLNDLFIRMCRICVNFVQIEYRWETQL